MNINKDYFIGGAAAAVIALVGYFSFSLNSGSDDLASTNADILEVVVTSSNSEDEKPSEEENHETVNAVEVNEANSVAE